MYKSADAKRDYFKKRYENNKEKYAKANEEHWIKYARKTLNKEDVTEDEVRQCKNAYYREYRRNNKKSIEKNMDDFWKRKAMEQDALRKEFLQNGE